MFTRNKMDSTWSWQVDHARAATELNNHAREEIVALIPALVKLRDYYLQHPERWIQCSLARIWDAFRKMCDNQCHWNDPRAECFCIVGGVVHFRFPDAVIPELFRGDDASVYDLPSSEILSTLISSEIGAYEASPQANRIWQVNDRIFKTTGDAITFLNNVIDELTLYISNHDDSATATEGATQ